MLAQQHTMAYHCKGAFPKDCTQFQVVNVDVGGPSSDTCKCMVMRAEQALSCLAICMCVSCRVVEHFHSCIQEGGFSFVGLHLE